MDSMLVHLSIWLTIAHDIVGYNIIIGLNFELIIVSETEIQDMYFQWHIRGGVVVG